MQALLQRVGGMTPAATTDPAAYDAELAAAEAALGGEVALEPSALAVSTLLGDRWDRLRAEFSTVLLPHACLDDIHRTEQALKTLQASTLTVHVDPDTGQLVRSSLTPDEKALLDDRLAGVVSAARTATPVEVASLDQATERMAKGVDADLAASATFTLDADGPWLAPVELALTQGLPLWSDDVVLRFLAREMGVPTFGTLALTDVLMARGALPDTTQEDLATLLANYVVDLPLNRELLLAGAEGDDWQPATVATAIGRPAAWIHDDNETTHWWLALGRAVVEHRPDTLPLWFHAAATGCAAAQPADPAAFVARLLAITLIRITGLQRTAIQALLPAAQAAADAAGGGDVLPHLSRGLIAYLRSSDGGEHAELEAQRLVQDLLAAG